MSHLKGAKIALFYCIIVCFATELNPADDQAVLRSLRLGFPALDDLWSEGDACHQNWRGVSCEDGWVTELDLSGSGLVGSLPSVLGNLTRLVTLNVSNNPGLAGEVPYVAALASCDADDTGIRCTHSYACMSTVVPPCSLAASNNDAPSTVLSSAASGPFSAAHRPTQPSSGAASDGFPASASHSGRVNGRTNASTTSVGTNNASALHSSATAAGSSTAIATTAASTAAKFVSSLSSFSPPTTGEGRVSSADATSLGTTDRRDRTTALATSAIDTTFALPAHSSDGGTSHSPTTSLVTSLSGTTDGSGSTTTTAGRGGTATTNYALASSSAFGETSSDRLPTTAVANASDVVVVPSGQTAQTGDVPVPHGVLIALFVAVPAVLAVALLLAMLCRRRRLKLARLANKQPPDDEGCGTPLLSTSFASSDDWSAPDPYAKPFDAEAEDDYDDVRAAARLAPTVSPSERQPLPAKDQGRPRNEVGPPVRIHSVDIREPLGGGNYGALFAAHWKGVNATAKRLRASAVEGFLQEATTLHGIRHPNIARLYGVYCVGADVYAVAEFCPLGPLDALLRGQEASLALADLLSVCCDVAAAMAYLEGRQLVHGNLGARNALAEVSLDGRVKYRAKICDLGLPRIDLRSGRGVEPIVAVKWTAPEALLRGRATIKADVWSFGITVWEIFSFGRHPYPNLSDADTALEVLRNEYRMSPPAASPPAVADLMRLCWLSSPELRPPFVDLHGRLRRLLTEALASPKGLSRPAPAAAVPAAVPPVVESDFDSD